MSRQFGIVRAEPQSPTDRDQDRLLLCLIVASDPARGAMFCSAAANNRWNPILCSDAESAGAQLRQRPLHLAIVDLVSSPEPDPAGNQAFLLQLARTSGLFVAVCGHLSNTAEEVSVRQVGVWVYLPGVSSARELSELFEEARRVLKPHTASFRVCPERAGPLA